MQIGNQEIDPQKIANSKLRAAVLKRRKVREYYNSFYVDNSEPDEGDDLEYTETNQHNREDDEIQYGDSTWGT